MPTKKPTKGKRVVRTSYSYRGGHGAGSSSKYVKRRNGTEIFKQEDHARTSGFEPKTTQARTKTKNGVSKTTRKTSSPAGSYKSPRALKTKEKFKNIGDNYTISKTKTKLTKLGSSKAIKGTKTKSKSATMRGTGTFKNKSMVKTIKKIAKGKK